MAAIKSVRLFNMAQFTTALGNQGYDAKEFYRELLKADYDYSQSTIYKIYNGERDTINVDLIYFGLKLINRTLDSFMIGA